MQDEFTQGDFDIFAHILLEHVARKIPIMRILMSVTIQRFQPYKYVKLAVQMRVCVCYLSFHTTHKAAGIISRLCHELFYVAVAIPWPLMTSRHAEQPWNWPSDELSRNIPAPHFVVLRYWLLYAGCSLYVYRHQGNVALARSASEENLKHAVAYCSLHKFYDQNRIRYTKCGYFMGYNFPWQGCVVPSMVDIIQFTSC